MSPAGLYLTCNIIRFAYTDDIVGGALPTGTVIYSNLLARIQAEPPTQALLEQGLETPTIFNALIAPGTLVIKHNDQLQVINPPMSPFYNEIFRVIGVQESTMVDPRAFGILTLRRIENTYPNVLQ